MKIKLLYANPKAKYLLFSLFILFSLQMSAIDDCGSIEKFEFTNGHESVSIVDGYVYNLSGLPEHFHINTKIKGASGSVSYLVENIDTGKKYKIIENLKPYTFPAGNNSWNLGKGKFKVTVTFYKNYFGVGECESMISTFTLGDTDCVADAGTLMSDTDMVTLVGGTATISATVNDVPNVPAGYTNAYVLTKGDDLIIQALGATPSFEVTTSGMYTIHSIVFDPNTLDTSGVGGLSAVIVNGLLIQGGGTICASLDVAGAKVKVEDCVADAGTLMSDTDMVTLVGGTATISATVNDAPNVPAGYTNAYVLTKGDDLIIQALGATPSFEVTASGMYTIHSIVFDPNTLDTSGVGGLSAVIVNGLLIQGGGTICASLDVAGAKVKVEDCIADAGTLMSDTDMVTLVGGTATISATVNDAPNVPAGYTNAYVLTKGDDLIIQALGATPSFEVTTSGMYTIHSIVFDPNTLDTSGVGGLSAVIVNGLLIQGGGTICASLDVAGAKVKVEDCVSDAGTLMSDTDMVTLVGGTATISATVNDAPNVPAGYTNAYVLTKGDDLIIQALGATPSFEVTTSGMYTIHSIVFDPNTLDTSGVGGLSAVIVNGLLIQGGGTICASLDVAGAKVKVEDCVADAGTLMSDTDMVTLVGGTATISATVNDAPNVPAGYTNAYVLTKGDDLIIQALGATPSFEVTSSGMYTIHSIVFDPNTLDTSGVGGLSAVIVNGLLIQGGGTICASLDVAGAKVKVEDCIADAGTLMSDTDMVTLVGGTATISATVNDAPNVPAGYTNAYVLTKGDDLIIQALGATPSFEVTTSGMYTIHSIVFDPNTLDTSGVGGLSAVIVNGLLIQGGGTICASLDVAGAKVKVEDCVSDAGTLMSDTDMVTLVGGTATISATVSDAPNVPAGYTNAYVLTKGDDLIIQALGATPSFEVTASGMYTIHSIVFDPNTLDTSGVGGLSAVIVNGLLIQGGGTICASLDVAGAKVKVEDCIADAGTLMSDTDMVTLVGGTATISATVNDAPNVPAGYTNAYVLTKGDDLIIQALGATPSFEVTASGMYTIHSIVFDPNTLDTSGVGGLSGIVVNGLLIQGGGTICASLDVAGAKVKVEDCIADAGTLMSDTDMVTLVGGTATISATVNDVPNVPAGYTNAYVLTKGDDLIIQALGATPSFEVTASGMYTIHSIVFDPNTLDTSGVGGLSAVIVNGLLIQGGGTICASLDVAGAKVKVEDCVADAGTLMSDTDMVTLVGGTATISATVNDAPNVPAGYTNAYVLTKGDDLIIQALGATPSFEVTTSGMYTIHSIVFDPNTLDTSGVGGLSAVIVNGLLIQGGGTICASLDVAGAKVKVEDCVADAGTLMSDTDMVTLVGGTATISATVNDAPNVPAGYTNAYVLTKGDDLIIQALGATPSFEVTASGMYTIHSIVFDPNTLDTSGVGGLSAVIVNGLLIQGGGTICASLDVAGAKVKVSEGNSCEAYSGTLYSNNPINCLSDGTAFISAKVKEAPQLPIGYEQLYVLTEAFSLTILNVSATPEFEVNKRGFYRIHSLVYDPNTLDLSVVVPGQTTGFDVVKLIEANNICASLDVTGAVNLVIGSRWFCYFFNKFFKNSRTGKTNISDKGSENLNLDNIVNAYSSYEVFKEDFIGSNSNAKFFPNPVVNTLKVEMEVFDDEVMDYSVIDVSGRIVTSGSAKSLQYGTQTIDTSKLVSGMYIMQFNSEFRTITKKIVVKK